MNNDVNAIKVILHRLLDMDTLTDTLLLEMDTLTDTFAKTFFRVLALELVKSKNAKERYRVARNTNTLAYILTELAQQDKDVNVRRAVANNPNTSPNTLDKLAQDKDEDVRRTVANNEKTLPFTLAELAEDKDVKVREGVAINPNTPSDTRDKLAQDMDKNIRRRINFLFRNDALDAKEKEPGR